MPTAAVTIEGISFTNTALPKLEKDPIIPREGAILLFDPKNEESWPSQAAPTGGAQTLYNLVRDGSAHDAIVPTAWTWDATKDALVHPASASPIPAGLPDLEDKDVLGIVWVNVLAAPSSYMPLMGRAESVSPGANNQFLLAVNTDLKPRIDIQATAANGNKLSGTALTVGLHQVGFWIERRSSDGRIHGHVYVDGAEDVSGTAVSMIATSLDPSTYQLTLGGSNSSGLGVSPWPFRRWYLEDLTASGRSAATVIADDYDLNLTRLS